MSWPVLTLGELTAATRPIAYGVLKPGDFEPAGVPMLRIVDLAGDVVAAEGIHCISGKLDADFARTRLEGGEVLLSIQGTVGRAAIVPPQLRGANISRTLAVIAPDARMDRRFLRLYLMGLAVRGAYATSGSTRASLNIGTIRSMRVPVPTLAEQRRIVEILEDHLSRLDAAVADTELALQRLAVWRESLVSHYVNRGHREQAVGDLLREPMRNGRSDRAASFEEPGTRCLTLTAVTRRQFSDSHTKLTVTTPERAAGLWLERGDVFVQRSNTPELVGSAARYDGPPQWAIFPDLLIRLRADESRVDSAFLALALQTSQVHRSLRSRAKGLAGSMPKIDQAAIAMTNVPVPSLDRQRQIIDHVAMVDSARDALLRRATDGLTRSSSLRRALLAAAFSGRLTGTDSDLERAEELIES